MDSGLGLSEVKDPESEALSLQLQQEILLGCPRQTQITTGSVCPLQAYGYCSKRGLLLPGERRKHQPFPPRLPLAPKAEMGFYSPKEGKSSSRENTD